MISPRPPPSLQFAASVVGAIGAKWTMVLGASGYLACTIGVATQTTAFSMLGGVCVGLGAGLLWSGQVASLLVRTAPSWPRNWASCSLL